MVYECEKSNVLWSSWSLCQRIPKHTPKNRRHSKELRFFSLWFPHTIQFSLVMVALAKEYILEGWFTNCVYIEQGQCLHKQSHILATLFQRMFQDSCCYMNKLKTYHSPSDFLRVRGVQHRYRHTSHGLSMGSKCGSYIHARLFQEFVVIPQIWLYRWATVWSLQTKQVLNIYIIPIIAFGREKIMSEVHFRMSKQNN